MTVLFDVFVLSRSVARVVDDALAKTDLNGFDYAMTSMLRGHGPISPRRVAELTGMPATTVSGVLRRLEERGFVERRPHPDDGRSVLVALTDDGQAATAVAHEEFDRIRAQVETHLGDQLPSVRARLQDLDDAVRAAVGVRQRPYRVGPGELTTAVELGPAQTDEVRRYRDWLLVRDDGPR